MSKKHFIKLLAKKRTMTERNANSRTQETFETKLFSATRVIRNPIYVDDIMLGIHSVERMEKTSIEVREIFQRPAINLRK